jgi:hypothetical protein
MVCDINSFRVSTERKVTAAVKEIGYDIEHSQFERSGANKRAADTNEMLGFVGVYLDIYLI